MPEQGRQTIRFVADMGMVKKDLKITLYDEKSKYSEKEDKRVILYKKVTNIYQIEEDGSITKLE